MTIEKVRINLTVPKILANKIEESAQKQLFPRNLWILQAMIEKLRSEGENIEDLYLKE